MILKKLTKIVPLKEVIKKINESDRDEALEEIGEYLLQSILSNVGGGKSPVQGGKYKKSLSKEYKKVKAKISGSKIANMELYGDMLDELDYKIDPIGMKVEIGFLEGSDEKQIAKADNHNKFSPESKKTKLPTRQFIPKSNQRFKKNIMKQAFEIASKYASEDQEEA